MFSRKRSSSFDAANLSSNEVKDKTEIQANNRKENSINNSVTHKMTSNLSQKLQRRRSSSNSRQSSFEVPPSQEEGDSSTGEFSSPETPNTEPDQKNDSINYKESKKQRKKKNRHNPRIIMSPPAEAVMPVFFEDDIRHRDGGATKKLSYEHDIKGNTLGTTRLEKSSSFKRKSKPANLEGLMARELDKKSQSGRPDSRNHNNNNNDTRPIEYNIILLGDFGVGKTALAVRFVTRRYLHEYDPALERTYEKHIQCSAGPAKVRLWDTVNKSFESFTEHADGFIVLYSTISSQTAHNAQNTIKSIRTSKYAAVRTIPTMLVGTKCELEHARKVKREDQEMFARQHGCNFKEISVACTINIDNVIKTLIEEIHITDKGRLDSNGHSKLTAASSLPRKPSGAKKHLMKNLLSSKKKEKS